MVLVNTTLKKQATRSNDPFIPGRIPADTITYVHRARSGLDWVKISNRISPA